MALHKSLGILEENNRCCIVKAEVIIGGSMAAEQASPVQTRNEAFWREYHSHDPRGKKRAKIPAYIAAALLGLGIVANSCGDDDSEPTPTTSTTTTTVPETTTTTTTTTVPETTTTIPAERFRFTTGDTTYDCEVVADPHTVVPGEHIWKIVDAQNIPEAMPQRWLGTIDLNQLKGTVGDNPNLIYPGDQLYTLVDCITSEALPGTE